jgi:hypothetical protein
MSWLFSQALAEEYSEGTSLAGEQFAQLNVMPTQHKFWRNDKTMEFSNLSRFGLTLRLLTESHGAELLTSFLVGFHAKTYPLLGKVPGLKESVAACGRKWRGSFARYDQDLCSWKTAQLSLLGDSELFSEIWPRWGSMRSGESYLRQTSERLISEKESGFSPDGITSFHTPNCKGLDGGSNSRAALKKKAEQIWPTPTVCGNYNRKGASKTSGDGLATAVKKWPTPTAHNAKETNAPSEANRNTPTLAAQVGGQLNPDWVEWLMGWPIGLTDLKPLAMDKFREWQQQHSTYFQTESMPATERNQISPNQVLSLLGK